MFCKKCGKEIPDDSAFCPKCGAQVNMEQPSGENSSFDYYANQAKQEVQKYIVEDAEQQEEINTTDRKILI